MFDNNIVRCFSQTEDLSINVSRTCSLSFRCLIFLFIFSSVTFALNQDKHIDERLYSLVHC